MKFARILNLTLVFVFLLTGIAAAEDVTSKLEQLGEAYAKAYIQPLVTALGINQNSGLYHTASIPGTGRISINLGLKLMSTSIKDEDKVFLIDDSIDAHLLDPSIPAGTIVPVIIAGPTVFGSETDVGTVIGYPGITGVSGLVDTSFMPTMTPEVSVAGLLGLRATLRWLPDIDLGDYGKVSYMGFGLQYSVNQLLPTLPVDVMVGFFTQNLDLGTSLETSATSMFAAASKSFTLATVYGGFAVESSSVDVAYTYDDSGTDREIAFSLDGAQGGRMTIGGTLNLGLKLNAEMSVGDHTSYTAGLIVGF